MAGVYRRLLAASGAQGWWPVVSRAKRRGYDEGGYHPGIPFPRYDAAARIEIATGAILTQNTTWKNASLAVKALHEETGFSLASLRDLSPERMAGLIRSSGYYNQKAKSLACLYDYFEGIADTGSAGKTVFRTIPRREELLSLRGTGPETADSILLYAWNVPVFVVDLYTRRIFSRLGLIDAKSGYDDIAGLFRRDLPLESATYAEYHALIVKLGKEHCSPSPRCAGCPLAEACPAESTGT